MKTGTDFLTSSLAIFNQYKVLAEKAMAQVNDEQFFYCINEDSNSIALVIKHMAGNMKSRWSYFLHSDGEKEWRNRDAEFEITKTESREELMVEWNEGWNTLFDALAPLSQSDLHKITTIRGEAHSVMEAVNRQIAHYSYHVGQIVFIAKAVQTKGWQTLSIAKGKSNEFNHQMKTK